MFITLSKFVSAGVHRNVCVNSDSIAYIEESEGLNPDVGSIVVFMEKGSVNMECEQSYGQIDSKLNPA